MESVGYQIVHSIAGRIRIRVPWLGTDSQSASAYQHLVEAIDGVKVVRINALAQSIVVEYSPKIAVAKMEELLIAAMQQVKLTPPAAAPTVEPDPVPVEIPIEDTIEPPPEVQPVEPPAKSSPSPEQSTIPEIPSPWDDEPLPEFTLEKPMTHTIVESKSSELVCSTSTLAKRLKVTSQAITRRRTKLDFGQWTQAQDPEGIAWCYHEDDRLFRPIKPE
ncbi:hypothetical protein IQ250_23590 [Pseudanabaenaceae cyanobacterium LEGE 13415]|nr:hypothetical protein [Pseudanabaenaceae cyanobacterium LEGE 13415]